MKTYLALFSLTLLGLASTAAAQVNLPAPAAPGSSPNTAVRLNATSDLMLDRPIRRWLNANYPGWSYEPYQITEIGMERYAVVHITHPQYPGRRVYFRVMRSMTEDEESPFPNY